MINKEIQFFRKSHYGNEHEYLKNVEDYWILNLTGTETLLPRHKASLKHAGFKFIQTFEDK